MAVDGLPRFRGPVFVEFMRVCKKEKIVHRELKLVAGSGANRNRIYARILSHLKHCQCLLLDYSNLPFRQWSRRTLLRNNLFDLKLGQRWKKSFFVLQISGMICGRKRVIVN